MEKSSTPMLAEMLGVLLVTHVILDSLSLGGLALDCVGSMVNGVDQHLPAVSSHSSYSDLYVLVVRV